MTIEKLHNEWKLTKSAYEQTDAIRLDLQKQLAVELEAVRHQWELKHAEFLGIWNGQLEAVAEIETVLRDAVVEAYDGTTKQIAPGCSVRVNTELTYDAAAALDFAKTHGICLKLDPKEFEKVAPTVCPQLVTTVETVTAVLSAK